MEGLSRQSQGGVTAAPSVVKGRQYWTPARRLFAGEDPGRRPGRLPGGHIDDLVAMKKAIMLCPDCRPKFDAPRHDYMQKSNLPFARGRCDGCSRFSPRMELLCDRSLVCNL